MSDITDKLQAKREVLRHYTDVLRETREAMGVPLDVALAANGLCESPDYDAQELLNADPSYRQWLDQIDSQEKDNADSHR